MNALLAGLAGAAIVSGIVAVVLYFRPAPPKKTAPRKPTLKSRWQRVTKKTKRNLLIGAALGLVAAIVLGLPIMIVVVPVLWILLPGLLGKPSTYERDLLLALETWARALASTSEAGIYTLKDTIGISRGSAPAMLQKNVERLYARMTTVWSTSDALTAFADELDSAYADEVVVYLVQAAEYNAGGLSKALTSVAENLSEQAKQKITQQRELNKPRETMISMTIIIGVLVLILVFAASFGPMNFYQTPLGNIALAVVLASVLGLMIWAKAITRTIVEPRILVKTTATGEPS